MFKPLFGIPLNRAHPLAQGLVASYLFNEGYGRIVHDSSGNENNGTMIGFGPQDTPASGWVPGPHGGAIAFNQSNNYLDCGSGRGLPETAGLPMTIVVGLNRLASTGNRIVVSKGQRGGFWNFGMKLNSSHVILFTNTTSDISTSITLPPREAIAGIVCYGSTLSGFVDGVVGNPVSGSLSSGGGGKFLIAAQERADPGWQVPYGGTLSFLIIYSRALSPEEISYLAAFPYCMYEQDEHWYSKLFNQNFYRRLLKGEY